MKTAVRSYNQGARAESAEATGRRIADAFLARLMVHWFDEITLDQVAEDAGVTVQTVVRRFGGKDGLIAAAVEKIADQINAQRETPPGDINKLIANLLGDYERTGDPLIRLLALEPRHPELKKALDFGRSEHRRWVKGVLAGTLEKIEEERREETVDSLVIATDVYTWKLLRRDLKRSVRATAATMKRLIQSIISETLKTNQ